MDKQVKGILKRTAAAALSAAMILTMGFNTVPAVVHAENLGEATEARDSSQEVKIGRNEIVSMEAKSFGPAEGESSDNLEASFDGDPTTYTNSNYNDSSLAKPQEYTFTFSEQVDLCKVRLYPRDSGGSVGTGAPNICTVQVSTDGSEWNTVVENHAVTDSALEWTDITFTATPALKVKLILDSAATNVVCTGEVELYKQVTESTGVDKSELKTAIDGITAKLKELDEADYIISTWEALETALASAQTVYANPDATEEQVSGALSDLRSAEEGLTELISPIYMTDFVSYENGRVTVELNGPTNYVPDGLTNWTYEYRDGKHLLYTDDWDTADLAPGETENYRSVCIYDMNGSKGEGTWSFVYISEDGEGSVSTEYGNRPVATITAGDRTYDLSKSDDVAAIADLSFTAAPVVHVDGVDLRGAKTQRKGGEAAVSAQATVSGDRTSMDFPLLNQSGNAKTGTYNITVSWNGTNAFFWDIQINSISVIDRSALETAISKAEALSGDDYTQDSWAAMQEKLAEAKSVLDDCIATATEVKNAADALNAAVEDLDPAASSVDKTALEDVIALAKECIDQAYNYVKDTFWNLFQTSYESAVSVAEDPSATESQVENAWKDLLAKTSLLNFESEAPEAVFVINGAESEITEDALLNQEFGLKFTDNGELFQFVLNGTEFSINGTEDTVTFAEIQSALNEGNGDEGKNVLVVRDSVPPAEGVYVNESTYTFYFDQTAPGLTVAYSPEGTTNQDVTVTITSDEALDGEALPEGWSLSSDGLTATKTYAANVEETVTFKDLAGNEAEAAVKIENIDKTPVDKTELEKMIAQAEEYIAQSYNYQQNASWDAFQTSYESAKNVAEDQSATQTQVDNALYDLLTKSASIRLETEAPEAVFVIDGAETEITEDALLNQEFGLKFTDNGKLFQFVLNGTEFSIDGTEDTVTFAEIRSALNEGNGEDGKNVLVVRDSVPPLEGVYLNESTYTFYFDQTPVAAGEPEYIENENGSVTVKISVDDDIDQSRLPEGWTYEDGYITKTFQESAEEDVILYDMAGNRVSVTAAVTISEGSENPKPEDPEKPGTGDSDKKPSDTQKPAGISTDKAVQTGDQSSPLLWAVVLVAACVAAGVVVVVRKRISKKK